MAAAAVARGGAARSMVAYSQTPHSLPHLHSRQPKSCLGLSSRVASTPSIHATAAVLVAHFAAPPSSRSRALASAGSVTSLTSSTFFEGEFGSLSRYVLPPMSPQEQKVRGPRAASDDVPSYKGFPPMTTKPKWWWRILACIPYFMPLSETWMYAETAYSLHAFLEDYEFCTYPFLTFIGSLPGWFLLAYFFGAYLGIVRNNRWPHFFRFHVVTGMLLEIIVQVVGTVNDWVPQSLYWGKLGAHYWLALAFAFFFIVLECITCAVRGMYADVPFLSDASYMQIPYDT